MSTSVPISEAWVIFFNFAEASSKVRPLKDMVPNSFKMILPSRFMETFFIAWTLPEKLMDNSSPGPKTYSLGAAMIPLESNEDSISKRSSKDWCQSLSEAIQVCLQ